MSYRGNTRGGGNRGAFRGGGSDRGGGRGGRGGYSGGSGGGFSGPTVVSGAVPPDANVTKLEDALQVKPGPVKVHETFPSRPGYGTKGANVTLWANYVVLTAPNKLVMYRYDLSVTPALTGKKLVQLIRLVLEAPELAPYKDDIVTDFKSTLISRKKLDNQTITVSYRAEMEDEPRTGAKQHQAQLLFTNVLPVSDLMSYLTSTNISAQYDEKLPMVQALNIFLNHYAKSANNVASIGASKTFLLGQQSAKLDLGSCLTAMRGFFSSVRMATARVLVNVNVSHGAFYQEGPLDQFILNFGSQKGMYKLQTFLKGLRIRTTHLKEKKNKKGEVIIRAKSIHALSNVSDGQGLAHPPQVRKFGAGPRDVQFWLEATPQTSAPAVPGAAASGAAGSKKGGKGAKGGKSAKGGEPTKPVAAGGRYISVYDFFVNTYGIRLSRPELPVVNAGNHEHPTYLPAEVCYVIPGQPAKSKLDPGQTQQMIRFAVRRPAENLTTIATQGLQTIGLAPNTNPQLGHFGITAASRLITVPGRILTPPKIVYRQNKSASVMSGGWNMVPRGSASLKFSTGGSVQKWSCLYIDMPDIYPRAYKFSSADLMATLAGFASVLRDAGIAAGPPATPQRLVLQDTDDPQLEDMFKRASSALQLLFIILPETPIPLYNRIKQLGDVKYGIHTVCSVGSKLAKPQGQDQYFRNVALKFNLKLGGSNQQIEPVRLGLLAEGKTMVVGIDVTHPSPGSSPNAPSIAGMVASIDSSLGQWPAVLSIQSRARQEMVSSLSDMLKSRLHLWRTKGKHTSLPENILVYRDGISEGQYPVFVAEELPLLRAACKAVYPPADQAKGLPRLTVVIVGKRHHTRFYPTQEADADRSGNSKAGTVVDRGVTEARNWDFFLQAHAALQGTVRPAHYYVLLDEIFRSRYKSNTADQLQDLTQSMCYVFGRATKAVNICTPAYYADILCERARCYLSSVFETPSNSATPSLVSGGGHSALASQQDVAIHQNIRDSMFYI